MRGLDHGGVVVGGEERPGARLRVDREGGQLVRVGDVHGPVGQRHVVLEVLLVRVRRVRVELLDLQVYTERLELRLQDRGDGHVVGEARGHQDPGGEAVRHAGLGHLLLGRGQVVLQPLGGRLVVGHLRREQRIGRLAVTEQHRLHQRGPVDGQRDRPAHVHVLKRLHGLVEGQVIGPGRVEQVHRDVRRGLQAAHRGPGRELVHLGLAALELQLPGVVAGHVGPGHAVEVRLALLPVVGVAHQLERAALVPEVPLERPGADRGVVELGLGLAAVVGGHDPVGEQRQVGEQRRPRVLEVDHHGAGGRRVDRLDGGVDVAPALGRGTGLVDGELHVGRRHRLAVGELHPLAQGERVGLLVRRHGIAGGQPRLHALAVRRHRVQRLHDLLEDPDRLVVEHGRVVHRLRVSGAGDHQVAAVHRSPGAAAGTGAAGA